MSVDHLSAPAVTHGTADLADGLRLHYVTAGEGDRTVLLVHGFPQTWWEWHRVIGPLAAAGFRVVAPDYRGAGNSSRPASGYDKWTLARDLHQLLHEHLDLRGPAVVVGHDIGLMVAYAYAQQFRSDVSGLVVADAPLPGTEVFDRLRGDPRVWHFAFHGARDVAEMLVAGRERPYLQAFFGVRTGDPSAVEGADFERYVAAYSAPGAMRAGFELYRAFDEDAAANRAALEREGRLTVPVLAVGGALSTSGLLVEQMMREVADDVTGLVVPGAGHWVPEERPREFTEALLAFLGGRAGRA
ncbi:Soluble epoxide hydrolase [Streptomyces sp. YIM 130001]|uniref:alpha/beta fold hydrolase n=1 Tax=Streptomyces sp. YIM 130001 TaxID=2259644 RepID=UPI000E64FC1A|nr:alpha/beta hydrolase [Streptomyces sp. YIM 130001]RII17832.1 Soluble epoxide hydrolase [Streptomyces sp. YIM 130001]